MTSYHIFDKLHQMVPCNNSPFDHGIRMRMANFFFTEPLETMSDLGQLEKWEEILAMSKEVIHFELAPAETFLTTPHRFTGSNATQP